MADLLNPNLNSYDNKDSLIVNSVTIVEGATFSQSTLSPEGAISSLYDSDDTTYYGYYNGNASGHYVLWDLGRKVKLKNLYVYMTSQQITVSLDGSNDNTNWTTLSSKTVGAAETFNLLLTNSSYRYYRIINSGNSGAGYSRIYTIKGTT